jgi:hypothetical protein
MTIGLETHRSELTMERWSSAALRSVPRKKTVCGDAGQTEVRRAGWTRAQGAGGASCESNWVMAKRWGRISSARHWDLIPTMASRGLWRRLGSTQPLGDASGQASSSLRSPREQVRGHTCRAMADRRQATRWRVGGGALLPTDFRINYENATKSNFQITLKNSTEVENL